MADAEGSVRPKKPDNLTDYSLKELKYHPLFTVRRTGPEIPKILAKYKKLSGISFAQPVCVLVAIGKIKYVRKVFNFCRFLQSMSLKNFIRIGVSVGLVILLLMHMDLTALMHKSIKVDGSLFALAVVCMMGQIYFLNCRWQAYLNAGGRYNLHWNTCMLINIAGYFANVLLIAAVGGIIAKSGLAMRHGVSFLHAVFATFLDRFMTLFALIIFSALGLPLLLGTIDAKIMIMLGAVIFTCVASVAIGLVILRSGLMKNYILSNRRRSRMLATLRLFMEDYRLMVTTAGHSLAAQACFFIGVFVISIGIDGHHTTNISFLALLPILALIASIPISFGGWGIREGAFIYGLGLIGFSMEDAFFLSVQVGLASLVAPFIVGLPYLLRDDFRDFLAGQTQAKSQPAVP